MDIFSALILCFICDLTFSQSESEFLHTWIEDGGKLEADVNLNGLYTKDQRRKWSLHAEEGVWALVFKKFSLERSDSCRHDYLQIEELFNITYETPVQPTRYCGEKLPHPYVSTSPRVEIRFVSDNLFEHDGFLIHVMHSKDEVALREKVFSLPESRDMPKFAERKQEDPALTQNNSIFYVLVGCSVAALILFAILLAYFVHSIQKGEAIAPSRLPEPYYIRATSLDTKNLQPDIVRLPDKDTFVCKIGKSGKRYLKDNNNKTNTNKDQSNKANSNKDTVIKDNIIKDINNKDKTSKKFVAQSHHNNLYVGNLPNDG